MKNIKDLSPEENPGAQKPPAFPSKFRITKPNPITGKTMVYDILNTGLTKLEFFAALAMQGSISADVNDECIAESHACFAIECAQNLISKLELAEKMEEKQDATEG